MVRPSPLLVVALLLPVPAFGQRTRPDLAPPALRVLPQCPVERLLGSTEPAPLPVLDPPPLPLPLVAPPRPAPPPDRRVTPAAFARQADPPKGKDGMPADLGGMGGMDAKPAGAEADIVAALNQRIVVAPETIDGDIDPQNVVIDRPELFLTTPQFLRDPQGKLLKDEKGKAIQVPLPFKLSANRRSVELIPVRLGRATVRIYGKPGTEPFKTTVRINPDAVYLNALLRARFPQANLVVTPVGDNFLTVDGVAETPGDVDAVTALLKPFFPGQEVINTVRVAGVMQVQLEVVIARVDRTQLRRLGVNLLFNDRNNFAGTQVGNLLAAPAVTLPAPRVFPQVGTNQGALTGSATAFFGVTSSSADLYGYLEALRQHNLAKVLANPTLVTFSGRQADFLVGGEQPIPVAGSLAVPSVQFKQFGTRLTFLPTVLGGGRIRLDVVPEVSTTNFGNSVNVGGLQVPQFVVQRIHATVEMRSGQTLCLGGLLQNEVEAQSEKVPVLGELPLVGGLFRRVRHRTTETELVVLITPRLVDPTSEGRPTPALPGQSTVSPTDPQLFGLGAIESGPPVPGRRVPPAQLGDGLIGESAPRPLPPPDALPTPAGYRPLQAVPAGR